MSPGVNLPALDQAGAAPVASDPLPDTFLGLQLDLRLDKLYDLGGAIPDVIGLQASQPRAAVVKVMSVPDSPCVRYRTIMYHLDSMRFSYIISRMRNFHLDWPRALLTFMSRY